MRKEFITGAASAVAAAAAVVFVIGIFRPGFPGMETTSETATVPQETVIQPTWAQEGTEGYWFDYKEPVTFEATMAEDHSAAAIAEINRQLIDISPEKEGAAEMKDLVDIDLSGSLKGVALPDLKYTHLSFILGNDEDPYPGLSNVIYGMKKGDETDADILFSDSYMNDVRLAGKTITFHIKINEIREMTELTDESVSKLTGGDYSTVDEYAASLIKDLEAHDLMSDRFEAACEAYNELVEGSVIGIPDEIMKKYYEKFDQEEAALMERNGYSSLEELCAYRGISRHEYETQRQESVYRDAKKESIEKYIIEKEGLTPDDAALKRYWEMNFGYIPDGEDLADIKSGTDEDQLLRMAAVIVWFSDRAEAR